MGKLLKRWWARQNSNLRPLPCQGSGSQSLADGCVEKKGHTAFANGTKRDAKWRRQVEIGTKRDAICPAGGAA